MAASSTCATPRAIHVIRTEESERRPSRADRALSVPAARAASLHRLGSAAPAVARYVLASEDGSHQEELGISNSRRSQQHDSNMQVIGPRSQKI